MILTKTDFYHTVCRCCSKFGFCGLGKKYCAPDVCVNGCNVKADCDPGDFGSDYVISSKCPLNVCCSKWGYVNLNLTYQLTCLLLKLAHISPPSA